MLHLLNVGKNKEIMTGHFSPIRLAGECDHRSLDAGRQSCLSPGEGRPTREPHNCAYPTTENTEAYRGKVTEGRREVTEEHVRMT